MSPAKIRKIPAISDQAEAISFRAYSKSAIDRLFNEIMLSVGMILKPPQDGTARIMPFEAPMLSLFNR